VYPYEPFPGSFSLLRRNIDLNARCHKPNVYPTNAALTCDDAESVTLNLNPRGSHGVHSLLPLHGRRPLKVNCVNIDEEIRKHRITSIKMDVEGAESLLIPGISHESWQQIDQFIMEYHFWYLRDYDRSRYAGLLDILSSYFSHIESSLSQRECADPPKTCILYARKGLS
jgi:FkbM family methyltransferase